MIATFGSVIQKPFKKKIQMSRVISPFSVTHQIVQIVDTYHHNKKRSAGILILFCFSAV